MGGVVDAIFGGGPDAPSPPDPYATASAQGAANADAARLSTQLNRANQVTPWGSQLWTQGGDWNQAAYDKAYKKWNFDSTFDPKLVAPKKEDFGYKSDAWTSTIKLDPSQQKLLDMQNALARGLGSSQENALMRVNATFANDIDTTDITQRISPEEALQRAQAGIYSPEGLTSRAEGLAGNAANVAGQATSNFQQQLGSAMPGIERVGPAPQSNDAYRQQIQDALYAQQRSRLDPRFSQASSEQEARLAAQGITQGSEAYNREIQNLGRERTDAYQQAMNNAISGGEAAIAGQYGRDLAGRGQDLAALGQYFNQGMAQRGQGLTEYNSALSGGLSGQNALQNAAQYSLGVSQATPAIAQNYSNLYGNQRAAELQEQTQLRNQILNELNALRSGAQVQAPQFGSTNTGIQAQAAPFAQSAYNSYQGDLSNYNAQVGSNNAMLGGLASLGGAAMMAPPNTFAALTAMI